MNPVMFNRNRARRWTTAFAACIFIVSTAMAFPASAAPNWITSWAASPQGPYPSGAAVAQPDLSFAFPDNAADDQTFRLIVRPGMWSRFVRIHFTNLFGNQPITLDGAFVGIQKTGAEIVATTNQPVTFNGGSTRLTLQPGESVWSDSVKLRYVNGEAHSCRTRQNGHGRQEACGQLPHGRFHRTDDMARQGDDDFVCDRPRGGLRRSYRRRRVFHEHHVVVLHRQDRHGCPRRHPTRRCSRRFDHRWDEFDDQRRRSLARRGCAAPQCRLRR